MKLIPIFLVHLTTELWKEVFLLPWVIHFFSHLCLYSAILFWIWVCFLGKLPSKELLKRGETLRVRLSTMWAVPKKISVWHRAPMLQLSNSHSVGTSASLCLWPRRSSRGGKGERGIIFFNVWSTGERTCIGGHFFFISAPATTWASVLQIGEIVFGHR